MLVWVSVAIAQQVGHTRFDVLARKAEVARHEEKTSEALQVRNI